MIRSKNHSFDLRKTLVRSERERGIRATAREFAVQRKTVRTWKARYKAEGLAGLVSRSSRPKTSPNKVSSEVEREVLRARERSGFGADRLVEEFELPCGVSAVRRILREHTLTRKPRKRHQKKNDLWAVKKKLTPFQRLQIDVKHLRDQPRYLPQALELGLPLYQYTVRDERTGAVWLSFASELASVYTELLIRRVLRHLRNCGVHLTLTIVKSDNGSEFKGNQLRDDGTLFADAVGELDATHCFNPPRCPNANADVESLHSRIEPEFYDREDFKSLENFLAKAADYQTYWNLGRPNRAKDRKAPWELMLDADPFIPVDALLLRPVLLDTLLEQDFTRSRARVGHKVSPSPEIAPKGFSLLCFSSESSCNTQGVR
jgi:transposase